MDEDLSDDYDSEEEISEEDTEESEEYEEYEEPITTPVDFKNLLGALPPIISTIIKDTTVTKDITDTEDITVTKDTTEDIFPVLPSQQVTIPPSLIIKQPSRILDIPSEVVIPTKTQVIKKFVVTDPSIPVTTCLKGTQKTLGASLENIPENMIYIGKAMHTGGWNLQASKWANTYSINNFGRDLAMDNYKKDILNNPELYNLDELKGKTLACWCSPEPCHGDILIELYKAKQAKQVQVQEIPKPQQLPPIPPSLIQPDPTPKKPVLIIQPATTEKATTLIQNKPEKKIVKLAIQPPVKMVQSNPTSVLETLLIKRDSETKEMFDMRSAYSKVSMKSLKINPATAVLIGRMGAEKAIYGITYPAESDNVINYINNLITK